MLETACAGGPQVRVGTAHTDALERMAAMAAVTGLN